MTKLEQTFSGARDLEVAIGAGDVTVAQSAGDAITVTVSGHERMLETIELELLGRTVVVRQLEARRFFGRKIDVAVEMPPGGEASVKTAAGDVRVAVDLGDLTVKVAAGDVRVNDVSGTCSVKSASGSVLVGHAGVANVASASGDIRVDRVDDEVSASTASGEVALGSFGRTASLKTASGDIVVERMDGDELDLKSMSGTVRVGLPPGLEVDAQLRSLSGSIRNELAPGEGGRGRRVSLNIKTVSGDIVLRSVPAAPGDGRSG